jgi:hypothetical protein
MIITQVIMLIRRLIQLLRGILNFDFEKITKHSSKMHNQLVGTNTTIFVA